MVRLPRGGIAPGVFAQRTGIPVRLLRHYDRRGFLEPAAVDPATGWRRYAPAQIGPARLLRALSTTGMGVEEAAAVVADGDQGAVLAHIRQVEEALGWLRDHLPVDRHDRVAQVELPDTRFLRLPLEPRADLLPQIRAARARLAEELGIGVEELPSAPSDLAVDGPWVVLVRASDDDAWVPQEVLLPWSSSEPVPAGWEGGWRHGGHHMVTPLGDGAARDGLLGQDLVDAVERVQRRLDARDGGGFAIERGVALDAALTRASLAVRCGLW